MVWTWEPLSSGDILNPVRKVPNKGLGEKPLMNHLWTSVSDVGTLTFYITDHEYQPFALSRALKPLSRDLEWEIISKNYQVWVYDEAPCMCESIVHRHSQVRSESCVAETGRENRLDRAVVLVNMKVLWYTWTHSLSQLVRGITGSNAFLQLLCFIFRPC